jgi:hypothetical protein
MILDPDVEQLVIDFLNGALPGQGITDYPAADRVPDGAKSITVIRTGGIRRDLVTDEAQITIDVRGPTNSQVVTVINTARMLLNDLWGSVLDGHAVYTVRELSGPYSNPTSTDLTRYSQSFLVAVRATQVI